MFYFMYLKWVPGPNFSLCVEASPHQQAILSRVQKSSSILTDLPTDSITFHRKWAQFPRPPFTSDANHKPMLLTVLLTNWVQLGGLNNSPNSGC